jgi:Ca2+-transporting ATPase
MITGDHAKTALSVARELGIEIDGGVVTGEELETRSMMQLKTTLRHTSVFARIEPKHKIKIVRALQSMGEVTAMTGDGVNDAPALRQADVGVAVGSGTDVTKETADLVLLDNNFKTIIAAISEGRVMYENIRKVITYLLSDAWSEVVLVLGSLAMGLPLPVFAVQILWVNFIEDVLPNIALSFERGEPGLMNEPPRRSNDPLIDRPMRILIFGVGASMSLLLFLLFWAFYRATGDLQYARTVAFMGLGSNSLLIVFSIRSLRTPLLSSSIFENRYLLLAVGFGFLALVAAIYIPTLQTLLHTVAADARAWSAVVVLGVLQVALIELVKYVFIVRTSNK